MAITAKTIADAITAKQRNKQLVAKTEKLEIELARMKREYVPLSEYKGDVIKEVVICKTRLLGLPAKIAPRLHVAESVQAVAAILLQEMRDILNELANGVDEVHSRYEQAGSANA